MVLAGTVGAQGICVIQDTFETLEQRNVCVLHGAEKLSTVAGAPVLRKTAVVDVRMVVGLRLMKY